MHALLVSTGALHPWCAFAACLCAEITVGTCVFCAACIHHIHGDVCVQYITLVGTRVCVFLFVKAPHIGAELIKSVY